MRHRFILLASLLLLLPFAESAEAKRFGGGGFLGKSYSVPKKSQPAPTQQKTAPKEQSAQPAVPSRSRGAGGLMAGLLAGGLFGVLLFGGAFEGFQLLDLLLLAGVIYLAYRLFFAGRRPVAADASTGAQHRMPVEEASAGRTASQQPSTFIQTSEWGVAATEVKLPQWLDKNAFLEGAQRHFIHLQQAWDRCDWTEIQSYCSAELFAQLQSERGKLPDNQVTEVVSVMADIVNCADKTDQVIISVHFYGWLREDAQQTVEFSEVWHLRRDMAPAASDWFIVGIEQH
ncbi:Tim44 domain-containing protein [Pontibacter sp. JAM-7]|uniref:Tim44 domain-containing protein n=1 Tax=Pontibacter sp. JAM-7 TaxID=3366581 RepID=UPI003AF9511B